MSNIEEYLPVILSSIGVILTAVVNWRLGVVKQKSDIKSADSSAESTFRDDILEQLKAAHSREETLLQREASRNETIDKLRLESLTDKKRIAELELTIIQLQHEIIALNKRNTEE